MRRILVFIFLVLGTGLILPAQNAKNISLVGHLDWPGRISDVWGYVDSQGTEYALLGRDSGFVVVSLANPAQPQELFFVPGAVSNWRDIKTWKELAYVCNETDSGLLIVDLSKLPNEISFKDTVMAGIRTAHNLWIDERGLLYTAGANTHNGGVDIFDLNNDPFKPEHLGFHDVTYVHDLYVRDGRAFLAEMVEGRLAILDVIDPQMPLLQGLRSWANAFTHNTWLSDDGLTCFTTDEISSAYIQSWDVSDPTDIRYLDRIRAQRNSTEVIPHNVHVHNDFLVTSYYTEGVQIVDASRPWNLIETGWYDTSPFEGNGFHGCWGAYPYLPSGLLLATDIEEGLFVLQPNYQQASYLEGEITDRETQQKLPNVKVQILQTGKEEFSDLFGQYATGTADGGPYQVTYSKFGYQTDTLSIVLSTKGERRDIALMPVPRVPVTFSVYNTHTKQPIEGALIQALPQNDAALLEYTTGSDGTAEDSRFVVGEYQLLAGKWGYITTEISWTTDANNGSQTIAIGLQPGYYDDFALDLGWQVTGTAERGMWERGEPIGTVSPLHGSYQPEEDLPYDIGESCYLTGNVGGDAVGFDVDNGWTLLSSPLMDLSNYNDPHLKFSYWLLNWSYLWGGRPGNDFLEVRLTDEIDTVVVATFDNSWDTTWNLVDSIRIVDHISLEKPLRVLFYTQDFEPGNQDQVEAAIDGFSIYEPFSGLLDLSDPDQFNVWYDGEQLCLRYDLPAKVRGPFTVEAFGPDGRKAWTLPLGSNPSGLVTQQWPEKNGMLMVVLKGEEGILTHRKLLY